MSFIDDSEKNIKFIKEVSGGTVAGFVGRSGKGIDDLFAGSFHPDSGHGSENEKLLQKQIKDRDNRNGSEEEYGGESPIGGYYDVDTKDAEGAYDELDWYDEIHKEYNDEFTPLQDIEWKSSGWDYEFDKNESYMEESDFVNTSETNMSYVNIDINYDKFDSSMGRDRRNKMFDKNYIQQSEDNIEEKIEDIELNEDDFLNRSEINFKTIYKNDIGLSIGIGGNII